MLAGIFEVEHSDANLLEIVGALRAASAFARGLNGRQQQCYQDTDNRNHDQQLDEGECSRRAPPPIICTHAHISPSRCLSPLLKHLVVERIH
jgi:hypothetical protein